MELSPFEDRFFLVTPISPKAHVAICDIVNGFEGECADLFSKYGTKGHFFSREYLFYI